jgi:hypothetical protein
MNGSTIPADAGPADEPLGGVDIGVTEILTALAEGKAWARNRVFLECLEAVTKAVCRRFGGTGPIDPGLVAHSALSTFFRNPVASRTDGSKRIRNWGELTGLLVKIAGFKWMERHRELREVALPDTPLVDERTLSPLDEIIARDEAVDGQAALDQFLREVDSAVDRLRSRIGELSDSLADPVDREILRLRVEGRSYPDISYDLAHRHGRNLTEAAVKQRFLRKMAPYLVGIGAADGDEGGGPTGEPAARTAMRADIDAVVAAIRSGLSPHELIIFRGMLDGLRAGEIADELRRVGESPRSADMVDHLWSEHIWAKVDRRIAEHLASPLWESFR